MISRRSTCEWSFPRHMTSLTSQYTYRHLEWIVDWKNKTIGGTAQHTMIAKKPTSVAVFDSSYLTIKSVATASGTPLTFNLPPRHKVMGSALSVDLPHELQEGEKIELVIEYETTAECTALGWLTAEQTASKLYPFVYSQCQVCRIRSLEPFGRSLEPLGLTVSSFAGDPLPFPRP